MDARIDPRLFDEGEDRPQQSLNFSQWYLPFRRAWVGRLIKSIQDGE